MAKKKKKNHKRPIQKAKAINWKSVASKGAIFFAFFALLIGSVFIYGQVTKSHYDLSVIGNGKATVVQIHDHNCQLCRQLKRNLDSVKNEFKDDIQFKTANILTKKGARFAEQHQVPHVTLLLFDKHGQRINTLRGVRSSDEIKDALIALEKRR